MSHFEKLFAFKKSRFGSFYSVKTTYFAFFVLFQQQNFELKKYNASDLELKKNALDFEIKLFRLVRF